VLIFVLSILLEVSDSLEDHGSFKDGHHLTTDQLQFMQDMFVGHPGEVQSKDKVVRAKGINKVLNGLDTPLWVTNNKAIFAQSF
jgi:hypothetical protein